MFIIKYQYLRQELIWVKLEKTWLSLKRSLSDKKQRIANIQET